MVFILQFIAAHWVVFESGGTVIGVAAAQNLPPPGTPWSWAILYKWFYETLQTVLPVRRPILPGQYPAQQNHEQPK